MEIKLIKIAITVIIIGISMLITRYMFRDLEIVHKKRKTRLDDVWFLKMCVFYAYFMSMMFWLYIIEHLSIAWVK